ncbi:MAG: hypothetical protein ACLFVJ_00775 [Persicimonas sp.]
MKKHTDIITRLLALFAFGLIVFGQTSCQEPVDEDEALKRQLERQKAAQAPRAGLSFGYYHELEDIDEGGPVRVQTDDSAQIEITEAHLVVSALEAHLCEPELAGRLYDVLVPSAHAHVPSSATRLGIPFVEDLFERSRARVVGEIAPPLGEYCRLYAVLSPADDDVLNLGALDVEEIEGKTLLVRGRWRPPSNEESDGEWQPFEASSTTRRVVELDAIDPNTGQAPLELDDPSQTKMLLLDKTVSPALFEGIDPESLGESQAADHILDQISDGLHIRSFKNN